MMRWIPGLFLSAMVARCAIVGYVDRATCDAGIEGWAADRATPSVPLTVTVSGPGAAVDVPASLPRPDVGAYLRDDGRHGFRLPGPLASGAYSIKAGGMLLTGGAVTLTGCAGPAPPPQPPDPSRVTGCLTGLALPYSIFVPFRVKYVPGGPCFDNQFDMDDSFMYFCVARTWRKWPLLAP